MVGVYGGGQWELNFWQAALSDLGTQLGSGVSPDLAPNEDVGTGSGDGGETGMEDVACEPCLGQEVSEGRSAISKNVPCRPGQAAVDKHNETHFPFRNWCDICVRGRGVEDGHPAGITP